MRVALLAIVLGLPAAALLALTSPPSPAQQAAATGGPSATGGPGAIAGRGQALFEESCASCHGPDARGVENRGPSLRGVGAAAIDFYVSTGRMPLSRSGDEPVRADPVFGPGEVRELIAHLTSLEPGGAAIPDVRPERGSIVEGRELFADSCAGCHQIVTQGGIGPGFVAPALVEATPTEIGEAVRVGPYLMPEFSPRQLDARQVDSIARYITTAGRSPENRGGWGIGNVGPVPEGILAFFLAGGALVLVARLIGERTR